MKTKRIREYIDALRYRYLLEQSTLWVYLGMELQGDHYLITYRRA
jgi:hypothetical protein